MERKLQNLTFLTAISFPLMIRQLIHTLVLNIIDKQYLKLKRPFMFERAQQLLQLNVHVKLWGCTTQYHNGGPPCTTVQAIFICHRLIQRTSLFFCINPSYLYVLRKL